MLSTWGELMDPVTRNLQKANSSRYCSRLKQGRWKTPGKEESMLIDHREEVESKVEDLIEYSKKHLLSESRAMALLALDTFFPHINSQGDISCINCKNYVDSVCGGKLLDFHGVINCMVNTAIHGTDHPRQPRHLSSCTHSGAFKIGKDMSCSRRQCL
jgi:hypothetical protein